MGSPLRKRTLFLSLDAFGTIFHPRKPIPQQYSIVGSKYGFQGLPASELEQSFRKAFKEESKKHPNYGKASGLIASQWWANIIKGTFTPYTSLPSSPKEVPQQMIDELLHRFSSKEGYGIYPDALNLFIALRIVKKSIPENAEWPWGRTVVSVVSNSDDRIISVLESLGLTIGKGADIEDVILSYDVGAEKPDPAVFEFAAKSAPEGAVKLHVGDDVGKDAVGALQAGEGWHGVLLDRERKYDEWNADQEHEGVMKLERDGHVITVLDSLEKLRQWSPKS